MKGATLSMPVKLMIAGPKPKLSAKIDVAAVGQTPAASEAAVRAAMSGKLLGKGTFIGLFKRN